MLKVIALGDIMGAIGRKALTKKLPELRKKYEPDFVVANCENLAHGCGVTIKTLREIFSAGVDFCTSGNHVWDKKEEFKKALKEKDLADKFIRPANYKKNYRKLGDGWKIVSAGKNKILVINLLGRVLMKAEGAKAHSPLVIFEEILKEARRKKPNAILVDVHAEATSEKRGFGWFADGKASLVWGTHTHIPTADLQIEPWGTGYITDLGMVGAKDSVIGEDRDMVIKSLQQKHPKLKHNIPEHGVAIIQGIYAEIETGASTLRRAQVGKTTKIQQIHEEVEI